MAYEQKEGYGALFKDTKPGRGEGAPEYTGTVKVLGRLCNLAGWVKEPKSGGKKYINLKITPADESPAVEQKPAAKANGNKFDDMEDDIPF